MAKKTKTRLVVNIPSELKTKVANTDFIHNGEGSLYFHNDNIFKKIKQKDLIVQQDESRLIGAVVGNNAVSATYEITLAELENLVKVAKKKHDYFKRLAKKKKNKNLAGRFFIHFNPELSFFIKK